MEGETVTIQEAMAMLKRSEKRVRDYILKDKKLAAEIGPDGRYHILKSDVERLVKNPGQIQVDKVTRQINQIEQRVTTIEQLLEALSTRLDEMTRRLDTLTTLPTMPVSRPATLQEHKSRPLPRASAGAAGSESKGLPDGAILASYFARAHGVNERTFADHCKKGIGPDKELAPVSQRPKPGREYQTEFYVMPEQVAGVLDYWRRHGVRFDEVVDEERESTDN